MQLRVQKKSIKYYANFSNSRILVKMFGEPFKQPRIFFVPNISTQKHRFLKCTPFTEFIEQKA